MVLKQREKIDTLERHITALQHTLSDTIAKQSEYLMNVEKRLDAVEKQPSIDGEKLLGFISGINDKIEKMQGADADKKCVHDKREDEMCEKCGA
jgi:uncharacterized protein YhaN